MRVPPIATRDIVRITQRWNPPEHYGTDYSCVVGTPILAAEAGVATNRAAALGATWWWRRRRTVPRRT